MWVAGAYADLYGVRGGLLPVQSLQKVEPHDTEGAKHVTEYVERCAQLSQVTLGSNISIFHDHLSLVGNSYIRLIAHCVSSVTSHQESIFRRSQPQLRGLAEKV